MIRVVLDANVLVSAALWELGPPAQVLDLVRHDSRFQLVLSEHIVEETRRILLSPKFTRYFGRIPDRVGFVEEYVGRLARGGMVTLRTLVDVVKEDPPDNKVLATALDGAAQYLVTGNERHLVKLGTWQGIQILTPAAFLAEVRGQQ